MKPTRSKFRKATHSRSLDFALAAIHGQQLVSIGWCRSALHVLRILVLLALPIECLPQQGESEPMHFSTFWPCSGNGSSCGVRILAEGTIQRDTAKSLARFLATPKLHKHDLPPHPTIVFSSPGGSVSGALALGRLIREKRLGTEVAPIYTRVVEGSISREETFRSAPVCASACVLAFAGGHTRTFLQGARVGIHQFSTPNGSIGDGATQVAVVVLATYLTEMGINRGLLDAASLVPPNSLLWLSEKEAKSFELDNTLPAPVYWRITPTSQGLAILEIFQSISPGRQVGLRIAAFNEGCVVAVSLHLEKATHSIDRIRQFPVIELPEVSLCADGRCIKGFASKPWTRSETGTEIRFQGFVSYTIDELQEMSTARTLSISDNFGTALSDVSFSSELSTTGFRSGVALLRRAR